MNIVLQVGAKALIRNSEGKYLFIKRSAKKYPTIVRRGSWDIPGGRIDPEKGLFENLIREVKEEVGLDIVGEPKIVAAQDIFYELKEVPQHVVRITYEVNVSGEPTVDPDECDGYKWVTIPELVAAGDVDMYVKKLIDEGFIS